MDLLEGIKADLKPDNSILKEVDVFVKKINNLLKKKGVKAKCVKGGSIAKNTFLKNDYDVDLFVRFDKSWKDQPLSEVLEKVLNEEFEIERVHGSRDYFQIKNELLFEVVPVLEIDDYREAENVTDMSPLHVDYVKKKLKKGQHDEVRLAKQFCKAAKVYGAESYIKGFSGHILDLLIIYYGSFMKLSKNAVDWKSKVVIDIEGHLDDPLEELDKAKTHSPLVIVDPVQPYRNAAAALSKKKFDVFKQRCKEFLKKPSREFFKVKKLRKKDVEQNLEDEQLFFLEAEPLEGKKDVVGSKLMKAFRHIKRRVKKHDFEIRDSGWEFDKVGRFYIILKDEVLPEKKVMQGPPIEKEKGVKRFKEKYEKVFEQDGRLFSKVKREYREAEDLIEELLKDKYVQERVKNIKLV